MRLKSMMLASVRPFYAAAGDPPAGGAADPPPGDGQNDDDDAGGAADPPADGAGGAADPPADGAADPPADGTTAAPAAPVPDWRDREIRRKHAQVQESKRREAELLAENETLRTIAARNQNGGGAADPPADGTGGGERPPAAPLASRDEVTAEANRIVAQQSFDRAANDTDAAGRTRYKGDWDKATETLKTLGGFDEPTMTAILATDDPAQVLHALGSKPDEYHRIMELPPARRQNELVKLGIPVKKVPPKPSDAAPPVDGHQTRPRGNADELRDDLLDEDWYARRKRQKDAAWAAKQRGGAPAR